MNYSGLLVASTPGTLKETLDALAQMPAVEVHQVQEEADRCIVVVEADSVNSEVELFKKISAIPSVIDVSLVVHHFEEDAEIVPLTNLDKLTQ